MALSSDVDEVIRMTEQVDALSLEGVSKHYGAVVAVADATVSFGRGEITGLVGENGAGKSTLISLVTGANRPDTGSFSVAGMPVHDFDPHRAREAGIFAIRQEPVLVPTISVTENLLLGMEPAQRGIYAKRRARAMAEEWLDRVGAGFRPDVRVESLSPADRQLVEIARAVGPGAKYLFFDEPTSALGPAETERLFELIRRLRDDGTAVVYVSHRLEEVFAICERVVVMRDGHIVADEPVESLDEDRLVGLMAGQELAADLTTQHARRQLPDGPPFLTVDAVHLEGRLHDVSLAIGPGEIHGVAGIVGAGRTSLLEVIAGIVRPASGAMSLGGDAYRPRHTAAALREGVFLVPEDRLRDALFPELPLATNTVLPLIDRVWRRGLVTAGREQEAALPLMRRLDVRPLRPTALGGSLSGGNQQKVILARALFADPRLLLLDEPTRGIDVTTKADIHELIRTLADDGVSVVVVSSDLRELLSLADRITVLSRGKAAGTFDPPFDANRLLAAATGDVK
jgi:L-arabinose transport system ATP-binding protein